MKRLVIMLFCVVILTSCGSAMIQGPFFEMPTPKGFYKVNFTSDIKIYQIILSSKNEDIKTWPDLPNLPGFIAINWQKGNYKLGQINGLETGTLPPNAISVAKGEESIGGFIILAEENKQMDKDNKQVLRIIHRVVIPLDGGKLEILTSIMPDQSFTLSDVKDCLRMLVINNKDFFRGNPK